MRWFRRAPADSPVQLDPARQAALVQEIRQRFGPQARVPFHEQADAIAARLDGDDGLYVAIRIGWEMAEESYAGVYAQVNDLNRMGRGYALDRRRYRALWRQAGQELRYPLFALHNGFHPYIHLPAALTVIAANAARGIKLADPAAVLAHLFEVLELTVVGWEAGLVRVDTHAAHLMNGLIAAAKELRLAVGDEPPALPPAIRELMRSNRVTPVYDPNGGRVIGGMNVGAEMRPAFLT